MSAIPKCAIGATDMSTHFKDFHGNRTGPDAVGRGDLFLDKDAGGLDIVNGMRVQVWLPFNDAGAGIAARGRWFDGLLIDKDTGAKVDTKTWQLVCADMNALFALIVRDVGSAKRVNIAAGSFAAQIAELVQILQYNGHGSVALEIDATSDVSNLYALTMPALNLDSGHIFDWYLKQVYRSLYLLDPTVLPGHFMGNNTTFGVGDVFGPPSLHIYDKNLEPAPDWTFDETNILADTYRRRTSSAGMIQRRQSIYTAASGVGFVATHEVPASQATYPFLFVNHGGAGGTGYLMAEPIKDTESTTLAEAEAALALQVAPVAYPKETIDFVPVDGADFVEPGDVSDISWDLDGLAHAIKRVASVDIKVESLDKLITNVQAGQRRGRWYEATGGGAAAPEEGDAVPPDPPTDVVADDTDGVYDPTTGFTNQPVSWTASESSDVIGHRIYAVQGTYHWPTTQIPDKTVERTVIRLRPGIPYAIRMTAYDSGGNESLPFPTPPDPAVTGTAAEPSPSAELYNPSHEIQAPYSDTPSILMPDGWTPIETGGGDMRLSTTHVHGGQYSVRLDATSGVGGTSAGETSRYKKAEGGARHKVSVWAFSEFPSMTVLRLQVLWYTGTTLHSTVTLASSIPTENAWGQIAYFPIAPGGVDAMKVRAVIPSGGALGYVWIDDWEVVANPPTPTFYNGSREIPSPDPRYPDGSTFTGDASVTLIDTPVRDGVQTLRVIQTTTQTLTELFTPMTVVEGNLYRARASAMWDEDTIAGLTLILDWQDEAGTVFQSDPAITTLTGTAVASYVDIESEAFVAPLGAVMVQLRLEHNLWLGGTPLTTYTDAIDVWDDTFQSDKAGSVKRSLLGKHSETVSVKDFGAAGDGATDDTAAIQAAIDSGAGVIHFPQATYFLANGSTLILASDQTLAGEGRLQTIISSYNAYALSVPTGTPLDRVVIKDMGFVLRSGATSGGAIKARGGSGDYHAAWVLENLYGDGQTTSSDPIFDLDGFLEGLVTKCQAQGGVTGFKLGKGGSVTNAATIQDCRVVSCTGKAIHLSGGALNRIRNCILESNQGYGIYIDNIDTNSGSNIIEGNWFEGNYAADIYLDINARETVIRANRFNQQDGTSTDPYIKAVGTSPAPVINLLITANIFASGQAGTPGWEIELGHTSWAIVAQNFGASRIEHTAFNAQLWTDGPGDAALGMARRFAGGMEVVAEGGNAIAALNPTTLYGPALYASAAGLDKIQPSDPSQYGVSDFTIDSYRDLYLTSSRLLFVGPWTYDGNDFTGTTKLIVTASSDSTTPVISNGTASQTGNVYEGYKGATLKFSVGPNGEVDSASGYKTNGTAGLASQVVALAKVTPGGSDGSITVSGGIVTNYVAPT